MMMRTRFPLAVMVAMLGAVVFATQLAAQSVANPFDRILATLDQLLTAVDNAAADLRGVTPNWDQALRADDPGGPCPSGSSRFTCVFDGAAVRDNQTGLVWEQAPTTVKYTWRLGTNSEGSLSDAREYCALSMTGAQMGWRLPSFQELASLADPSLNDNEGTLTLPPGHPFSNIAGAYETYWSSTTHADNDNLAWMMGFARIGAWVPYNEKSVRAGVWCVRGGAMANRY